MLNLDPVTPDTHHGRERLGVPVARVQRDVVSEKSPTGRQKGRRLTCRGTDTPRAPGATVTTACRLGRVRIELQLGVRRGNLERTADNGTARMSH